MIRLLDIEGTVCPVSFVHDALFPYARARLPAFVAARGGEAEVRRWLAAAAAEAGVVGDEATVAALLEWIDQDRKATPLKALQGLIWSEGWRSGAFVAPLYPDVAPAMRRWHESGDRLAIYSSGSAAAQQELFAHTSAGDLTALISGYFDTNVGPKREPDSYSGIAAELGAEPAAVVFYSDVLAEIEAARAAGLQARWIVRDGPLPEGAAAALD